MITYNIKINPVKCRTSHSNIVLTTGDVKGYVFKFAFEQTVPDYSFITLKAKRADGRIITAGAECAEIVLPSDMYCVPGEIVFEVALCGEDGSCVTVHVLTALVREGFGDNGTEGDDRFPVLTTLIKGATESKAFFDSFRDENGNLKGDCFANGSIAEEKLTEKLVKKINIQSDWNEPDSTSVSYINNKPDLTLKENKANKVTAITGNETAEKYPNVHAVINYLQSHGMTEAQAVECIKEYFKYNSAYMHEVIAGILLTTPAINVGYAENWGSVLRISQSGNATSLQADLETKANEMKLLYKKKITESDRNSEGKLPSFVEFLPETPLRKIYVYTYCPKDTTANTNKLFFKFGSGSYITDSVGHANIATDSAMWGIKELDLEQHKHITHGNNIKTGYPGSLQSRNNLYPYSGSNTYWTAIYDTLTFEVKNLLSGIKFSTNSDSVYFPIDTILMVWGC